MKKALSIFLSLCITITAFVFSTVYSTAAENTITDTEVTWSYDESSKVLTFAGKGEIPDYDTYTDVNGQLALSYPWKDLEYTSIVFGDEITSVGNYAFCYSKKLETVVFPDTITQLGQGLFLNCTTLKSVDISDTVTVIPVSIFANCSSLESVTLSEKTSTIESRAFYRCSSLTNISFPESLTSIGNEAFSQCTGIDSIVIPDATTSIGDYAFYSCESLTSVDLGKATKIGEYAFNGCSELTKVDFPDGTTEISSNVFGSCPNLADVTIPNSVTAISGGAFSYCNALKSITIPYYVKTIGIKAVGYGKYNAAVAGFTITGYDNTAAQTYATENGFAFNSLGVYTAGKCGENATWSFSEETKILTIGGTGEMDNFTAESLPFYTRFDYTSVEIADGITSIGAYAFTSPDITSVSVPFTVKAIGDKAIGYKLETKTTEVTDEETGAVTTETTTDFVLINGFEITGYVNSAAYQYATDNGIKFNSLGYKGNCTDSIVWSIGDDSVLNIEGTGAMPDYLQDNLPEYSAYPYNSIKIGDGITSIGAYAFTSSDITSVFVPFTVKAIGDKAIGYKLETKTTEITDEETGAVTTVTTTDCVLVDGFEITGYPDTAAESYAVANSIKFNAIQPFTVPENAAMIIKDDNTIYLYATDVSTETFLTNYMVFSNQYTTSFDKVTDESNVATNSTLTVTRTDKTNDDSTPITETYTIIVMGDVNGDGKINSADALVILQHAVSTTVLTGNNLVAADLDNDAKVNSSDALTVLQLTVGELTFKDYYDKVTAITE